MTFAAESEREGLAVRVKYLVGLRDRTGRTEEQVRLQQGSTLKDLADLLNARYDLSLPDPHIMATLNGKGWEQYPGKLSTELSDGDSVLLFPPVSAG